MSRLREKLLPPTDPLRLITPERMVEIRAEAREKAIDKLRKKAEESFLAAEMQAAEREFDPKPEYEMRDIVIDVAEHTEYIRIDGKQYYYGQRYRVPKPVYDQLVEIIARGWQHEREISAPSNTIRSMNRNAVLHGTSSTQGAVTF